MYLHEYQSKQYFARFGIQTPPGKTAETEQEAFAAASEFGVPVVVNAQALDNQRVFRLAQTPEQARLDATDILAMTLSGVRVGTVLIEPATRVAAEYFLGIYGDRGSSWLMIASSAGGHDISEIERAYPHTLSRETIKPFLGVLEFQARNLASGLNLPREHWNAFTQIAQNLYRCAVACDAVRAEINPLGLTSSGELLALGGKLVIDDNALFRQTELASIRDVKAEPPSAVEARAAGISYVHLSGSIGCVVSGAGLGMATLDMLARHNAAGSSLLDLGGDIQRDKISAALRLILPDARAVLFNIFADKTSCVEAARE
ncbi:MAG: ATP-grasp domain-containing protein, partial [Chloroflexota bacterium]